MYVVPQQLHQLYLDLIAHMIYTYMYMSAVYLVLTVFDDRGGKIPKIFIFYILVIIDEFNSN